MLFHPVTGCAMSGCRRAHCVHEQCWGADVPPEQARSRPAARAGELPPAARGPGPGLHRGGSVGRRPGREGRSSAHRPGAGPPPSPAAPLPHRGAAPPPAPRRTLVCLFRVGGACRAFRWAGPGAPLPRVGARRAPAMLGTRRVCAAAWLLRAALGPEPGRSASGARGQGWLQPAGYDTGVKVYNSLTRRKDPLIVSRADAASW